MERFSVIFISLYSLAILARSMPIGSSTTTETLWDNTHDNTTQVGEHVKNVLFSNKTSNASITSTGNFSSSYTKDTQYLNHNEDRNDEYHKEKPSADLASHDILLDPSLIVARRLNRQAEKDANYSNLTSIKNISNNIESNNYDKNKSVVPLKWNRNEDDLGVAEDRYQPPYPYWYPYYRGQFPNQRYRANGSRNPYRNYWRYPVFPGK